MSNNKKYSAIIVEDELLPRLSLIEKLKDYHPEIDVIAACETAQEALELTLKLKPKMLFLDIQLSDHTSLWLVEQLQNTCVLPHLIFTTAHSEPEYLLKAIKFGAVDYLLKPVNISELATTIRKIKEKIDSQPSVIILKTLHSDLRVKIEDIFYFVADGNYCKLFLSNGEQNPIFERLGVVEDKFANTTLFRTDKSHLINIQYLYKLDFKHKKCFLKSPSSQIDVVLPESGIAMLRNL